MFSSFPFPLSISPVELLILFGQFDNDRKNKNNFGGLAIGLVPNE